MVVKKKYAISSNNWNGAETAELKKHPLMNIKGFKIVMCDGKGCQKFCKNEYKDMNRCYQGMLEQANNPFVGVKTIKKVLSDIEKMER
jgi:hypothetical protein